MKTSKNNIPDNKSVKKESSVLKTTGKIIIKVGFAVGIMYAFYKVPGIVAEKVSYRQLMKKDFNNK